jgi:hypothetical protein
MYFHTHLFLILSVYIRVSVKKVICVLGILETRTVGRTCKLMLSRSQATLDYLALFMGNGASRLSLVWGLLALIIQREPL